MKRKAKCGLQLKAEDSLWPHAEQEVEDGEIWHETMLVLEYLPVFFGFETGVG